MKALDFHNAEIGALRSRKDRSVSFTVVTSELTDEHRAQLFGYHGAIARVLVAPHDEADAEVVEVEAERDMKTPSQRLRGCIFRHWEQAGKRGDFDTFYRNQMDMLTEAYKERHLE